MVASGYTLSPSRRSSRPRGVLYAASLRVTERPHTHSPRYFTHIFLIACSLTVGLGSSRVHAQESARQASGATPLSTIKGKEFTVEKWADGVYQATGGAGSQECIVVGARDVLLFDSGTTPAGAKALLEDIKLITDKPVKTVVNSHFHYDHVGGNSVFGPDVQLIGHTYTRTAITTLDPTHREPFASYGRNTAARMESAQKQLAGETDPAKKAQLQPQLAVAQRDAERIKEISFVPPRITFDSKLFIDDGTREIQLLFLGRGHTAGDIVMYLPKEKIVCSGDLVEGGLPYMGDGYFDEWVTTLQNLKALDFDLDLPGHGRPFREKSHITNLQSYLKDLVAKVEVLRSQGVTPEQAVSRIDLSSHEKDWPPRMRPIDIRGMRRVYQWLDERGAKPIQSGETGVRP